MLQGGGRTGGNSWPVLTQCPTPIFGRVQLFTFPCPTIVDHHPPMAFRKRNVGINRAPMGSDPSSPAAPSPVPASTPGIRPSPVDGRSTTSTGTPSLDGILAGHAGFALGSSILVEESGTTDFAGALLKYYAAEGIIQGHKVHVVGLGEPWGRELPGLVGVADGEPDAAANGSKSKERMKIAWRYEKLGEFEAEKRIGGARGVWEPAAHFSALVHITLNGKRLPRTSSHWSQCADLFDCAQDQLNVARRARRQLRRLPQIQLHRCHFATSLTLPKGWSFRLERRSTTSRFRLRTSRLLLSLQSSRTSQRNLLRARPRQYTAS